MKKSSAFTLLELLITIAISGVLASIAIPSFTSTLQNSARTANTNALIGSLLLARNESIRRGTRVSICDSADSASCQGTGDWQNGWVVWVDSDSSNSIDVGEDIIQVTGEAEGSNVTIKGTPSVALVASFVSTGFPESTGGDNYSGTFSICDVRGIAEAKAIKILASGRIRGTSSVASVGGSCP